MLLRLESALLYQLGGCCGCLMGRHQQRREEGSFFLARKVTAHFVWIVLPVL